MSEEGELAGIPDFVRDKLVEMRANIDQLESVYEQLEQTQVKDLQARLSPLDFARLNWINIYSINSLFFGKNEMY